MKRLFLLFSFVFVAVSVSAQVHGSAVYVGMSMPRKDVQSAGAVIGYKYQYDLPVDGLGVIGSVDFRINGPCKTIRDANDAAFDSWLKTNNYDDSESKVSRRSSADMLLPINFGVNYSYYLGRVTPWVEGAIGFATVFNSGESWKAEKSVSVSYDSTNSHGRPITVTNSGKKHYYRSVVYKPAVTFSYKFGLGAVLDYRYSFGVEICGISKYTQKETVKYDVKPYWNSGKDSYKDTDKFEYQQKGYVYVALRLGYHF